MEPQNKGVKNAVFEFGLDCMVSTAPLLSKSSILRHGLLNTGVRVSSLVRPNHAPFLPDSYPGIRSDKADFGRAFVATFDRMLTRNLSRETLSSIAHNLVSGALVQNGDQSKIAIFSKKYNAKAPGFLTISPGKTCNLQCKGCYASAGPSAEKLTFTTFDRIITEAKENWGIKFFVISGGEPLAYKSEGKTLLDAAEKHKDVMFMFYTNGTLIDRDMAQHLAKLGNITPAISLEGWKEKTDDRRGAGTFDKILTAMANLREAGVLFGISLTATRFNCEEILSNEFIDFFFNKQGAFYGWIFQYMPIGRSFTLDLMPTVEQRTVMRERTWNIIRDHKIFLADFWNHATLSNGCLAGGGAHGGYLYIDWDGHVSPCVFVPYSPVNINDVYAKNGTLVDAWQDSFFAGIRNWQKDYTEKKGNWLAPCLNRDHHEVLNQLIQQHEPDPIDESARQALSDPEYQAGLEAYGREYEELTHKIWRTHYLDQSETLSSSNPFGDLS